MAQAHQKMVYASELVRGQMPGTEESLIIKALRDERAEIHGQIAA
jgi:hypothetical protein